MPSSSPTAPTAPYFLKEGDIMKAKPKHFIPRPESVGSVGQHPVIVLTRPDSQGFVLVAPMSHNHPEGTPTRSASRYGLPVDPIKGESRVNVGQPKVVHQDNLRANKPYTTMAYNHFAALKAEISYGLLKPEPVYSLDRSHMKALVAFRNKQVLDIIPLTIWNGYSTNLIILQSTTADATWQKSSTNSSESRDS
ncbi:hypothetical protein JR316_0009718, partial [Psilocybe cubensis]